MEATTVANTKGPAGVEDAEGVTTEAMVDFTEGDTGEHSTLLEATSTESLETVSGVVDLVDLGGLYTQVSVDDIPLCTPYGT